MPPMLDRLRQALKRPTFLLVTLFAAVVLVVETVLFNILLFEYDYFVATMGLGFVVFGIGLGSLVASRVEVEEETAFLVAAPGTAATPRNGRAKPAVAATMERNRRRWIGRCIPILKAFLLPVAGWLAGRPIPSIPLDLKGRIIIIFRG